MCKKSTISPIWLWVLCFFIGVFLLYWWLISVSEEALAIKDWISIYGSYSSLYGLIVILIQFQSVKKTARKTQEEISKITSITEWSRYAEMASNIKDDIRHGYNELAVYKFHQIKQALLSIPSSVLEYIPDLRKNQQDYIKSINNHISTLDSAILDSEVDIPKEKMMRDMEQVSDFFRKMVNLKLV